MNRVLLKRMMIIFSIVLLIEIIVFFIYKRKIDKESVIIDSYDSYYRVLKDEDYIITIGATNERKKENIEANIIKYDKNFKEIKKTIYDYDNLVSFFDIIKIDNGYIVVGAKLYSDEKINGLIIKLDNDLNIIKEQEYSLLNRTVLRKIVKDNDHYILIGHSQYEEDRIGNHLGGGIILKIDEDLNILESNNYGGNKSGYFANLFVLDDSYLVTGYDAECPIIVKFNKNFNREKDDTNLISNKVLFHKTFEKEVNNTIYFSYNSLLYNNKIYFINGNYDIKNETLELYKNSHTNEIYLIEDESIYTIEKEDNESYVVILSLDNKEIKREKIDMEVNDMIVYNDKILVVGLQSNNKNISPKYIFIDKK